MTNHKQPSGHAARGPLAGKAGRKIEGVFVTAEDASRAVNDLLENSVPADQIQVDLVSAAAPPRRLRVGEDSGTSMGALAGAVVGAVVGLAVAVLASFGALGDAWAAAVGSGTALGILSMTVVSAVAGVPIGAVFGMAYWQGRRSLPSIVRRTR